MEENSKQVARGIHKEQNSGISSLLEEGNVRDWSLLKEKPAHPCVSITDTSELFSFINRIGF